MNLSLKGMTAVVCGSTQGIGLAIAEEFAAAGANCILFARNEQKLQEISTRLQQIHGGTHSYRVADFNKPGDIKLAIESVVRDQPVHILVNNSGGPKPGPITEAGADDFLNAFQQHIVNNQALVQTILPGMKKLHYGRIINIISTSVKIPLPDLGVSNTIRAAVASWAKSLSNEIAQYAITVNNILPGLTETGRLRGLISATATARQVTEEEITKRMIESVPARRFAEASEIANLAAFLASPAAGYINGTSIPVDGGRTGTI